MMLLHVRTADSGKKLQFVKTFTLYKAELEGFFFLIGGIWSFPNLRFPQTNKHFSQGTHYK